MHRFSNFSFYFLTNTLDKIKSVNEKEASHQVRPVGDHVERRQDVVSGARLPSPKWVTPPVIQPQIDATDRRQIEAQNEDKAHTTKETLDDIKRIHQKEKKKKEEDDIIPDQSENASEGGVSRAFICQKDLFIFPYFC